MKDRTIPYIYYTCAHQPCQKGHQDVTMKRCKNCSKYRPRKVSKRQESVKSKREKDKNRHDDWRKQL